MGIFAPIVTFLTSSAGALFLTGASIIYQQNQINKARRAAEAARARAEDAAATRNVRISGSNEPIPFNYGLMAVHGSPVLVDVTDSLIANETGSIGSGMANKNFGNLQSFTGDRNETLIVQRALGYGEIEEAVDLDIDNEASQDPLYLDWHRNYIYYTGTQASTIGQANSDHIPATSTFDDISYSTEFYRMNRDDPQFGSRPSTYYYIKGRKIRDVTRTGAGTEASPYVYALTSTRTYSNNAVRVLLDYMLDPYGVALSATDVSLESFYDAIQIAGKVVQDGARVQGKVNGINLTVTPGTDTTTRDILKLEFNGPIYTDADHITNISEIMDVIPGGVIFRDALGLIKINIPDEDKTNVQHSVMTITDSDLIGHPSIVQPDNDNRLNEYRVDFLNASKDFVIDSVTIKKDAELLEDNNLRLNGEAFYNGVSNVYHAEYIADTIVEISRRDYYTFEMRPEGFLLEPGDVVLLSSDVSNHSRYIRIGNVRVMPNLNIAVEANEFQIADYSWIDMPDEEIRDPFEFDFTVPGPTNLNAVLGAESPYTFQPVILTWADANNAQVNEYLVEYSSNGGLTWNSSSTVSRGIQQHIFIAPFGGSFRFRITSVTFTGRESLPVIFPGTFEPSAPAAGETIIRLHENLITNDPGAPTGADGLGGGWYDPTGTVPDDPDPHWEARATAIPIEAAPRIVEFDFSGMGGQQVETEIPTSQDYEFTLSGTPGSVSTVPARPEITEFTFSGTPAFYEPNPVAGRPEIWNVAVTGSSDPTDTTTSAEELFLHVGGTSTPSDADVPSSLVWYPNGSDSTTGSSLSTLGQHDIVFNGSIPSSLYRNGYFTFPLPDVPTGIPATKAVDRTITHTLGQKINGVTVQYAKPVSDTSLSIQITAYDSDAELQDFLSFFFTGGPFTIPPTPAFFVTNISGAARRSVAYTIAGSYMDTEERTIDSTYICHDSVNPGQSGFGPLHVDTSGRINIRLEAMDEEYRFYPSSSNTGSLTITGVGIGPAIYTEDPGSVAQNGSFGTTSGPLVSGTGFYYPLDSVPTTQQELIDIITGELLSDNPSRLTESFNRYVTSVSEVTVGTGPSAFQAIRVTFNTSQVASDFGDQVALFSSTVTHGTNIFAYTGRINIYGTPSTSILTNQQYDFGGLAPTSTPTTFTFNTGAGIKNIVIDSTGLGSGAYTTIIQDELESDTAFTNLYDIARPNNSTIRLLEKDNTLDTVAVSASAQSLSGGGSSLASNFSITVTSTPPSGVQPQVEFRVDFSFSTNNRVGQASFLVTVELSYNLNSQAEIANDIAATFNSMLTHPALANVNVTTDLATAYDPNAAPGDRVIVLTRTDDENFNSLTIFQTPPVQVDQTTTIVTNAYIPPQAQSSITVNLPTESISETILLEYGLNGTAALLGDILTKLQAISEITDEFTITQDTSSGISGLDDGTPIIKFVANDLQDHSISVTFSEVGGTFLSPLFGTIVDVDNVTTQTSTITINYDESITPDSETIVIGGAANAGIVADVIANAIDGHDDLSATSLGANVVITTGTNRGYAPPTITIDEMGTTDALSFVVTTTQDGIPNPPDPGEPSKLTVTLGTTVLIDSVNIVADDGAMSTALANIRLQMDNTSDISATLESLVITATTAENTADDLIVTIDPGRNQAGISSGNDLTVDTTVITQQGRATSQEVGVATIISVNIGGTSIEAVSTTGKTLEEIATEIAAAFNAENLWSSSSDGVVVTLNALFNGATPTASLSQTLGSYVDENENVVDSDFSTSSEVLDDGSMTVITGSPSAWAIAVGDNFSASGSFDSGVTPAQAATEISERIAALVSVYNASTTGDSVVAISTFNAEEPDITVTVTNPNSGNLAVTKTIVQVGNPASFDLAAAIWDYYVINQEIRTDDDTISMMDNNSLQVRRGIIEDTQAWDDVSGNSDPNGVTGSSNEVAYFTESFSSSSRSTMAVFQLNMLGAATIFEKATDPVSMSFLLQHSTDNGNTWTNSFTTFSFGVSTSNSSLVYRTAAPISASNTLDLLPSQTYWFRVLRIFTSAGAIIAPPADGNYTNFLVNSLLLEELVAS